MSTVTTFLKRQGIEFETLPHPRAVTSIAEARALGVAAGEVAKTIVVKTDAGYVLAVVPGSRRLDERRMREATGDSRARLATEAEIAEAFPGFEPGALPPIALLLRIPVYIDDELTSHDTVVFAGGFQTESVKMRTGDLLWADGVNVAPLVERETLDEDWVE